MNKLEILRRKLKENEKERKFSLLDPFTIDLVEALNDTMNDVRYSFVNYVTTQTPFFITNLHSQGDLNLKREDVHQHEFYYDLVESEATFRYKIEKGKTQLIMDGCGKVIFDVTYEGYKDWITKKVTAKHHFELFMSKPDERIFLTDFIDDNKPTYEFDLDWNPLNQVPDGILEEIFYLKLQEIL